MVPGVRFALTKFLRPGVGTYFDFSRHAANVLHIHHIELQQGASSLLRFYHALVVATSFTVRQIFSNGFPPDVVYERVYLF